VGNSYLFATGVDRLYMQSTVKEGRRCGDEVRQESLLFFSSLEDRVLDEHPLRTIRGLVEMSPLFDRLYAEKGGPSIPPECLLRASLLQRLYATPSELRIYGHLEYNLPFRWFVGLPLSEPTWDHSAFSGNRGWVLALEIYSAFFTAVRDRVDAKKLLSRVHFSCDGTLIEAAASMKSLRPVDEEPSTHDRDTPAGQKGRNPNVNFRGRRRTNDTHTPQTGHDGCLKRMGGLSKLLHRGLEKVAAVFTPTCRCYNLVRLSTLMAEPALATG